MKFGKCCIYSADISWSLSSKWSAASFCSDIVPLLEVPSGGVPEQGFEGVSVEHKDGETQTGRHK